ncbi:MAG: hypothetical protein ABWW66_06520 [Archaeoglobaceae archaeon]
MIVMMIPEAEFEIAMQRFVSSAVEAKLAADKLAKMSEISESLDIFLSANAEMARMLLQEIRSHPEMNAKLLEAERTIFENIDVFGAFAAKFIPYIYDLISGLGLLPIIQKIVTLALSL